MAYQSDEQYTPDNILQRMRLLFDGPADLDPCSNPGIPNVPCRTRFTKSHNGLIQDWFGKVLLNPPYSRGNISAFIEKALEEYRHGRIQEVLILHPMPTDTIYFSLLNNFPLLRVKGRLRFKNSHNKGKARFPSGISYLGPHVLDFAAVFDDMGVITTRYRWSDGNGRLITNLRRGHDENYGIYN